MPSRTVSDPLTVPGRRQPARLVAVRDRPSVGATPRRRLRASWTRMADDRIASPPLSPPAIVGALFVGMLDKRPFTATRVAPAGILVPFGHIQAVESGGKRSPAWPDRCTKAGSRLVHGGHRRDRGGGSGPCERLVCGLGAHRPPQRRFQLPALHIIVGRRLAGHGVKPHRSALRDASAGSHPMRSVMG